MQIQSKLKVNHQKTTGHKMKIRSGAYFGLNYRSTNHIINKINISITQRRAYSELCQRSKMKLLAKTVND